MYTRVNIFTLVFFFTIGPVGTPNFFLQPSDSSSSNSSYEAPDDRLQQHKRVRRNVTKHFNKSAKRIKAV